VAASALAAGLVAAFSVPPWGVRPLGFVGIAAFAWRLSGLTSTRTRAFAGALFAFGIFAPTLFWISEFHAVGYVALLVLEASFFAAAAAVTPPGPVPTLAVLPATLVIAEWARGQIPFGGLPMGGLALGQADGPLAPAARLGGALLVFGLTALAGCGLAALVPALLARSGRNTGLSAPSVEIRLGIGLLAAVVVLAGVARVAPDGGPDGRTLRVAIVQGGGPRGFRAVETDPGDVLVRHLDESRHLRGPLDLVVWPENTIDVTTIDGSAEADELAAVAEGVDATVVAGVTEDVGSDRFENVAVAWSPQGEMVDRYTKEHRVPFGEYVPLRGLIAKVADLSVLPRDAVAGRGPGVLRTPAGTLGVAISYEVFFGERARAAMRAGGQVLLVPTNAASFKTSQVPTQEVASARLRAWETGRWVLQSAPTGYGAVIDPDGRVLARTTLSRAQILTGRPSLRSGHTLYVTLGDLPLLVLAGAAVTLAWFLTDRRRRAALAPVPAAAVS
jgi:apolipoprotein N-acyltransferase